MKRVAHVLGNEWRSSDVQYEDDIYFTNLLLSDSVLYGLKSAGFVRPSPIQNQAIPLGRAGLDLIIQAKSGTGKTCVFAVVALEKLLLESKATQTLVLAPTREVAVQICQVVQSLGAGFKGLKCHAFIGGIPLSEDKIKLKKCHIAVGTPGRVKQLIKDGILKLNSVRLFVLDEADKLLEEGFQETINWIYSSLPVRKQMLALSATYPEALAQLLQLYMNNPSVVRLSSENPALIGVTQFYCSTPFNPVKHMCFQSKIQALMEILKTVTFSQCLVFSNYQTRAESLCDVLKKYGWPTDYISGSQEQSQRLKAIDKLKQFKCRVLVSTDVTSRGIDAENVNLVINIDVPWDVETYLHRIGRAGRFGTRGLAVTFISGEDETELLQKIKEKCGSQMHVLPDPMPPDLWSFSTELPLEHAFPDEPTDDCASVLEDTSKEGCVNMSENKTDNVGSVISHLQETDHRDDSETSACRSVENISSGIFIETELQPLLTCESGHEQTVFSYDDLVNDFGKSLQEINSEDNNDTVVDETEDEVSLLLKLNAFLASNHQEYQEKLKNQDDKSEEQVDLPLPEVPQTSSCVGDSSESVLPNGISENQELTNLNISSKTEINIDMEKPYEEGIVPCIPSEEANKFVNPNNEQDQLFAKPTESGIANGMEDHGINMETRIRILNELSRKEGRAFHTEDWPHKEYKNSEEQVDLPLPEVPETSSCVSDSSKTILQCPNVFSENQVLTHLNINSKKLLSNINLEKPYSEARVPYIPTEEANKCVNPNKEQHQLMVRPIESSIAKRREDPVFNMKTRLRTLDELSRKESRAFQTEGLTQKEYSSSACSNISYDFLKTNSKTNSNSASGNLHEENINGFSWIKQAENSRQHSIHKGKKFQPNSKNTLACSHGVKRFTSTKMYSDRQSASSETESSSGAESRNSSSYQIEDRIPDYNCSKQSCHCCSENYVSANMNSYDTILRTWWKPNLKMAFTYLEFKDTFSRYMQSYRKS